MAKVYGSVTELIGGTPLLEIKNYEKAHGLKARLLVKLEGWNPGQSSKDRPALAMIEDAERNGTLKPGDTIVEITSGNTGIGLALVAAAKGYKFRVYMNDKVSLERFQTIKALGGEIIKLSEVPALVQAFAQSGGNLLAVVKVLQEEVLPREKNLVLLGQMLNPENPHAHETTTGPEIWNDTDGQVDFLVATVGTGGTITGTSRYLKTKNPDIQIVAAQPGPGSVPSKDDPTRETIQGIRSYTGTPEDLVPPTFDINICDQWIDVETPEAYAAAKEVARLEGLLVGASSGAAIHAAAQLASLPENEGKTVVAILPDTGLRYLSTKLYD